MTLVELLRITMFECEGLSRRYGADQALNALEEIFMKVAEFETA